jgi:hypothetical protein
MRTRTATALLTTGLTILLLAGCEPTPDSASASAVQDAVAEAAGGSFSLSDVEGISGSSFLVVCPYETEESVSERLGTGWDRTDASDDEGVQTIAVLDGDAVESRIVLERDPADFCSGDRWHLLPLDTRLAVSESRSVSVAP